MGEEGEKSKGTGRRTQTLGWREGDLEANKMFHRIAKRQQKLKITASKTLRMNRWSKGSLLKHQAQSNPQDPENRSKKPRKYIRLDGHCAYAKTRMGA